MKNILLIRGGPRRGGNTDTLADAFVAGAESAGHTVAQFHVADLKISPCRGCRVCCNAQHPCVHQDDMNAIYQAFDECSVVVFASPVYFDAISAQLKTVIDRLYCIGGHTGFKYPHRECALLMVAESHRETCFDLPVSHYHRVFSDYMGWTNRGEVLVKGVDNVGEICGNAKLEAAYRLGQSI